MALVIETGLIVPGAESFATADELATYATNFGKIIPTDPALQESLLRRSALQMNALHWRGRAIHRDQALAWPRIGVMHNGWEVLWNVIPPQIKAGQMALAAEIYADDLSPPELRTGAISREKVGPIDTEYATVTPLISKPASVRQSYAQFSGFVQPSGQVSMRRS